MKAVIGMGSNLGNREANLRTALECLDRLPHTRLLRQSKIYQTEPFGVPDEQPDYLNMVAEVETGMSPRALLGACLGIESALGRVRPFEKSARTLDLDLLVYENEVSDCTELTLPHPRISERAFVLVPLSDLYPNGFVLGFDFSKSTSSVSDEGVIPYVE